MRVYHYVEVSYLWNSFKTQLYLRNFNKVLLCRATLLKSHHDARLSRMAAGHSSIFFTSNLTSHIIFHKTLRGLTNNTTRDENNSTP